MPSQVVMVEGLVSGLESCAPFALVWNRFQPPCVGGSFFCRRVATLPQSGWGVQHVHFAAAQRVERDRGIGNDHPLHSINLHHLAAGEPAGGF